METLLFSTLAEAKATLARTQAVSLSETLFKTEAGYLLITGIGSIATLTALASLPQETTSILSLGISGALSENLELDAFYEIGKVKKFFNFPDTIDSHSKNFGEMAHPQVQFDDASPYTLLTSDYPIHQEKVRSLLSQEGQLIDMEGYAIAYFCQKQKIPLKMVRLVSDFAKETTRERVQSKLAYYSELLQQVLISFKG